MKRTKGNLLSPRAGAALATGGAGIATALALLLAAGSASASEFPLEKGQTAVGGVQSYTTKASDVFFDIARHYDIGYIQLLAANRGDGVNPWVPGAGRKITIPTFYLIPKVPHRGIVIDLPEKRIFYFPPGGGTVQTFPVGVGIIGQNTPNGTTTVVRKEPNPVWYPPPSMRAAEPDLPRVVPAGPDNPLGQYALHLGWPNYLIHGTDHPEGVGWNVSHGCIHMFPENIDQLFHEVKVGTPVRVIDQDVEVAWVGDQLYVQVSPNKKQSDQLGITLNFTEAEPAKLEAQVQAVAGARVDQVDWQAVRRAGLARTGIPTAVTKQAAPTADAGETAIPVSDEPSLDQPASVQPVAAPPASARHVTMQPDAAQQTSGQQLSDQPAWNAPDPRVP